MYRVMYMSTATRYISDEELEQLLEISRKNNEQKGLTGLLIVKGRTFLQCLEGERSDVLEIYSKILNDERHTNIIDLIEEDMPNRLFPDWTMGYKNLKNMDDIKSEKLKKISDINELDIQKEDISEIIEEFISFY